MKIDHLILKEDNRGQQYKVEFKINPTTGKKGYRYFYIDQETQDWTPIPDNHPFYQIKRGTREQLIKRKSNEKNNPWIGNASIVNINGKNKSDGTAEYDLKTNGWNIKDYPAGQGDMEGKPLTGLTLQSVWNQLGVGIGGTTKTLDIKKNKLTGQHGKINSYFTGASGGYAQTTRKDASKSALNKLFVAGGVAAMDKLGMYGNPNTQRQIALDPELKNILDKQVNLGLGPLLLQYLKKVDVILRNSKVKMQQVAQESISEAPKQDFIPSDKEYDDDFIPMPDEETEAPEKSQIEKEQNEIAAQALKQINDELDAIARSGWKDAAGNSIGVNSEDTIVLWKSIVDKGQYVPAVRYLSKVVPQYNQRAMDLAALSKADYFADKEIRDEFLQKLSPEEFDDYKKLTKPQADKKYGEKLGDIKSFQKWKAEKIGDNTLPRDRQYKFYNPKYDDKEPGDRAFRPNKDQKQQQQQTDDAFKANFQNKLDYAKAKKFDQEQFRPSDGDQMDQAPFPSFNDWIKLASVDLNPGSTVNFISKHETSKGKRITAIVQPKPTNWNYGIGFEYVKSIKTKDNPNPGPNPYPIAKHRFTK